MFSGIGSSSRYTTAPQIRHSLKPHMQPDLPTRPICRVCFVQRSVLSRAAEVGLAPALLLVLLIFLAGVYIGRAGMAAFGRWPAMPTSDARDPGWLLRAPMLVLAFGALGLGWLLHGRLESGLALEPTPEIALGWQIGAVLMGVIGLAFGAWRVRQHGPVPAFGGWPAMLERGLQQATAAPHEERSLFHMRLTQSSAAWMLGRVVLVKQRAGLPRQPHTSRAA